MATKNEPGAYDCYSHAEPDEPMFVLLARDPCAPALIALWVTMRVQLGKNEPEDAQLSEAIECSNSMATWADRCGRGMTPNVAPDVLRALYAGALALIGGEP